MKNKHKKAVNLAEMFFALGIIGVILTMMMSNAKKQSPDMFKAKFKKTYSQTEKIVSTLINDDNIYPAEEGFKFTNPVETEFGETFGMPNKYSKFRDAFMYQMNVKEENIECQLYAGSSSTCFKNDLGVIIGIPDTDFEEKNVITLNNVEIGIQSNAKEEENINLQKLNIGGKYVPITIYVNTDDVNSPKNAIYIGVSALGKVKLLHPEGSCDEDTSDMHCKAEEFLLSDTIKTKR